MSLVFAYISCGLAPTMQPISRNCTGARDVLIFELTVS
jgi:hypothetical protein